MFQEYAGRGELVPDEFTIKLWRQYITGKEYVNEFHPESEFLVIRPESRLLELDLPRIEASSNGLTASWRTTGELLEPPDPPGALDRALLSIRPWRLAPPRRAGADPPFLQALVGLYVALAVIVGVMIGLCFLIARLVTGNAV